jgi:WD40 repeat protein
VSSAEHLYATDSNGENYSCKIHTARVWNVATGKLLATLEGHTGSVQQAAFSADGQRIVTASGDKTARVYHVVTLSNVAKLLGK